MPPTALPQWLFFEAAIMHLLAWWGIRILTTRLPLVEANASNPSLWAVRLLRAGVTVAIVLAWARWRNIPWPRIGLGGQSFIRNFIAAAGVVITLGFAIAAIQGTLWVANPSGCALRVFAVVTRGTDVLAQQLSVFGLLQGFVAQRSGLASFALALLSFALAHFIIGGVLLAFLGGNSLRFVPMADG